MTPAGLPHSDTPGSQLGCQLPRAYRRLQRPSSALDAKASTVRPSQLVSQTLNKNHKKTHKPHPPRDNTHPRRAGPYKKIRQPPTRPPEHQARGTRGGGRQMLASTIHLPNTPPTGPRTRPHTAEATRERRHTRKPHQPGGLIPQGPTVCQTNPRTPHPRLPHPQLRWR
jgi:hypothetical protein